MFNLLALLLLPPLFVFGVYHLLIWGNPFRMNDLVYWRRVAWSSVVSHCLLATGFFAFSYFEYTVRSRLDYAGMSFGSFLFNRSGFWQLMLVLDTAPTLVILALFATLDRLGINLPQLVPLSISITYLVGTLQWYWTGGGIGALLERFWAGLKTDEEEDEDWL